MRKNPFKQALLAVGSILLLYSGFLMAAEMPPPPAAASQGPMDWVQHTQEMLDDLKTKLNLTASEKGAWDTWSDLVLNNARAQSEKISMWRGEHMKQGYVGDAAHAHMSTPDRMAHGLEHMRTEIKRMQDHVALLEVAQASTKRFYDTLDPNQKTIFDLYWQQSYQWGMGEHGMMGHEGRYGPAGHGSPCMDY